MRSSGISFQFLPLAAKAITIARMTGFNVSIPAHLASHVMRASYT